MKQKGLAPILIVIILAALVGGYLIYQNQSKPTPSPQPTTQPSPSSADETANWKTYTNQKFKFGFKYPDDWIIKEETDSRRAFGLMSVMISSPTRRSFLDIIVQSGTKEQFEKELAEKATKGKVGNIIAWILKTGDSKTLHFPSIVYGQTITITYGVIPNDSPESEIQVADQILSTFKFLP